MLLSRRTKILIIRFSSFGDVTQSLSIPSRLAELANSEAKSLHKKNDLPSDNKNQNLEIHWATRADMAPLLENHPNVHKIWLLDRKQKLSGLWQLIQQLKRENFTHIYDAHNNLRSWLICLFLRPPLNLSCWFNPPHFIRKSQKRWKRFLLFKLRINTYEMPFSGQRDLLEPLQAWGLKRNLPPTPQLFLADSVLSKIKQQLQNKNIHQYFTLAPSAAYELKRWPVEYFIALITLLKSSHPSHRFVCLGGPEDTFIEKIQSAHPDVVINWAGQLSLTESAATIALSNGLVANDTGLLHVAEQLGQRAIALMGPAPFGFPSREKTNIMQLDLKCRPCSKHGQGPCINKNFHQCLRGISAEQVAMQMNKWDQK